MNDEPARPGDSARDSLNGHGQSAGSRRLPGRQLPGRQLPVRDLRGYARQTHLRLVAGAALILFLVGDGLIHLIFGPNAALMGLVCLAGGLLPVAAIALVLSLLEWVVKRANRE